MSELEEELLIFSLDEESEEFRVAKEIEEPIYQNLNSNSIYCFVDSDNKTIWIWHGKNANVRKKFIAVQYAPIIRNKHGIDFKITGIDEGDEPMDFKTFIGSD
jgi:hypothetical protein